MGRGNNKRPFQSRKEQDERRSGGGDGNDSDNEVGDGVDPTTGIHRGSIPLDDVKSSPDFQRRVVYENAPKRKYALNFGYLGSRYQGLQINPGAITVEAILEKALFLAGGIAECNYGCLNKLQWTRTARTDRGVHALSQCCAMKLMMPLDERDAFMNSLNTFLPEDIRVHSISKVTKNFHGKILCTKRRYHYLLPTYVLQESSYIVGLLEEALAAQGTVVDAGRAGGFADPGSTLFCGPDFLRSVKEKLASYRISSEKLALLRAALGKYVGTRPYHNFTTGKSPSDSNAKRYILSFDCSDAFLDPITGCEWVQLSVLGQSFLLNQIRKMVGLVVGVCDGSASLEVMDQALSSKKMEIPMVPGLGLYLDELFFESYNKKQEAEQQRLAQAAQKKAASASATAASHASAANNSQSFTSAATESSSDQEPASKVQKLNTERNTSEEGCGSSVAINDGATTPAPERPAKGTGTEVADAEEGESGPSIGEKIDWFHDPAIKKRMETFRTDVIWPHIFQEDQNSLCFLYYADYLRVHPYRYIAKDFVDKKSVGGGGQSESTKGADAERGGAPRGVPPKVIIKGPVTGGSRP
jgi:tRNA pseudouridine(38-40) synthase